MGAAAGAQLCSPVLASETNSYKPNRFSGQTLNLLWPSDYMGLDAPIDFLPEFTKKTGIKIDVTRIPYTEIKEKIISGTSDSSTKFDVFAYIAPWKTELFTKNCIADLGPMFKDPSISDPNYDFEDLIPGFVVNSCLTGGRKGYLEGDQAKLVGIPRGMETSILAYKKDIFSRNDLKVPASYTEFRSVLKALSLKAKVPAMTARLKPGHHCVHSWLLHFNPLNGVFFDDNWQTRINEQPGVEAVNFLKLVAETGVPNLQTFGFAENQSEFITGKSAMYLDSTGIISALNLPKYSAVKNNVGYALHPRGSKYSSAMAGFACGISPKSQKQQAAFVFLQWLTNKEQDIKFTRAGVQSNRRSTLASKDLLAEIPYLEILRKQLLMANPDWRPMIAQWDTINIDYLGKAIPEVINGTKAAQAAMNDCATGINALMRKNGY